MFLLYFVLFVTFIYFLTHRKRSHLYKFARQVGGPSGYPLIGCALEFLKNGPLATLTKWIDKHGDRFVVFLGPVPILLVNNAEDLEKICTSNEMLDKSEDYDRARAWLGNGLITSTGQHWQSRRKLITPCFHFTILERFVAPIHNQAEILASVLKEHFVKSEEFKDIGPFIARCTLDIICETSMGKQMNSQRGTACEYVEATHKMENLYIYRNFRPWLHSDIVWNLTSGGREEVRVLKTIHGFTDQVIAERKQQMKKNSCVESNEEVGKERKALLDLLLEFQEEDPLGISDEGLREEITTFTFAGHDTISDAVSFCLHVLGDDSNIQGKVHKELDSIFSDDPNRPITSADLRSMKYLELCIKETLRLYATVPIIGRRVSKPFQLDDQTVIPPGVGIFISPYKLHHNPKYFTEPQKFLPERFDPESELDKGRSPFAYIPFSAGYRNCIGQKLAMMVAKIILATVLRQFRVKSEKKGEELQLFTEVVLRSKDGIRMKLEFR